MPKQTETTATDTPAQPNDRAIEQVRYELERFASGKDWKEWAKTQLTSLNGVLDKKDRLQRKIRRFVLQNWAEELAEDAISVLCFGESMVTTLNSVLRVAYEPKRSETAPQTPTHIIPADLRHPPASFRVEVAQSLATLMLGGTNSQGLAARSRTGTLQTA